MDIKDSYLHGTVGVVKSISVDADKLSYKLADVNNTTKTVTIPTATQSANGLLSSTDKKKLDSITGLTLSIPYIVGPDTDTTAGTWTGSYTGITEYTDGLTIIYVPKVAGASTTTLNINGLGAITCYYTNTSKLSTHYSVGTPIMFTYVGGYWRRADYADGNTYTSAYCTTAAATAAKTASCSNYTLNARTYLHVLIRYSNTAASALTLSVNSSEAKPIYINGAASSSSNYTLPAGTYIAYYDGTNFYFRTDGVLPGTIEKSKNATSADKVKNDLILKINSGTTEGTSLYTYNGSSAKTLDIKNGTGIGFTNNAGSLQIYNSGVRSIATGTANGTISVNTNGTSTDVAVKGLGSAAYTKSSSYIQQVNLSSISDIKNFWESAEPYFGANIVLMAKFKEADSRWGHLLFKAQNPRNAELGVDGAGLFMCVNHFERWKVTGKDTEDDPLVLTRYKIYDEGTLKVVSSTENGLTPKVINTNTATIGSAYYILASTNGSSAPSWYKLPSNAFANDDTKVTQTNTTGNSSYRVLLSGTADDTTRTEGSYKTSSLCYNPSSQSLSVGKIITIGNSIYLSRDNAPNYIWATKAGSSIQIGVNDGGTVGNENATLSITGDKVYSGSRNNAVSLGTSSVRWSNIYSVNGNFSGDITINATGNKDYFINFLYNSTPNYSWRLGYLGSGSGDANYFVLQSSKSTKGNWHNTLQFGNETLDATFTGTVTSPTFIGNLDGTYINKLTGYSKATAIGSIAATDSLKTALGKLELKADTTYELVKGAYDGDGTIENLAEILKVLEGIKDTETIQAIVGKYLPLTGGTLTGKIDFVNTTSNNLNNHYISAGGGYSTGSGRLGLKLVTLDQTNAQMGLGVDLTGFTYEHTIATSRTSDSQASYITFATHTSETTQYKRLGYFKASGDTNPSVIFKIDGLLLANSGDINGHFKVTNTEGTFGTLLLKTGTAANKPRIRFEGDRSWGYLGFSEANKPCYYDNSLTEYTLWHAGNDGANSGLDADLLDGTHKADLFTSLTNVNTTANPYSLSATIGDTTKFLKVNSFSLAAQDIRDTTPTPHDFLGKSVTAWFNCNDTPGGIYWYSGITVAGWYNDYRVWLLASSSHMTDDATHLHFRTGRTSTWDSWRTVLDSSNYTSYTVKKDGTGASGTWGIDISGTASKLKSTTAISSKALSLVNTTWTDTGYTFANLTTGTYAIQVTSGSNLVASGIMSVYKNLSDTVGDEIPLHVYGTAGWRPYLRTYANKLLISSNDASATSRTVTIKIAQIL